MEVRLRVKEKNIMFLVATLMVVALVTSALSMVWVARFGFLGCATKEIAEHFGKYFGMLITETKYADKDFEVIESKYII